MSDTFVRKFPPLAELLKKGVGGRALEKVTGGSWSPAADENAFKSVRILNPAPPARDREEPHGAC